MLFRDMHFFLIHYLRNFRNIELFRLSLPLVVEHILKSIITNSDVYR